MNLKLSSTNLKSIIAILTLTWIAHAKVIPQNTEIFQKSLDEPGPYNDYLERVNAALQKMLVFYNRQYKKQIIDGVYGLRVLEGEYSKKLICYYISALYSSLIKHYSL